LKEACREAGVSLESLGRVGPSGKYPLLLTRVGAKIGRPVCLAFGVHGNEISGPLGALNFIRNRLESADLPKLLIFPVVNPWGFEHDRRADGFGNDLNRKFVEAKLAECLLIKKLLITERPSTLLSFHEDDELGEAYFYAHGDARGSRLMTDLKHAVGSRLSRRRTIYGASARFGVIDGLADGSLEYAASVWGVPRAVCCEVPDRLTLKRRIELIARMIGAAVGT
jgi:predicted deacylase